jgi:inner membrane protein
VAANLPDLDALVFATGTPSVAFRRGWTHGVVGQALLPLLLTAVAIAVDRRWPAREGRVRAHAGWLLALSYVGVLAHVGLDFLNNYGVRLLMPFSNRWFYGDAVFIIDPWLWLTLGTGAWMARRARRPAAAGAALTLAGVYIALMLGSAVLARRTVLDRWTAERGRAPEALMVGPVPINPLRKTVIVDAGDTYEIGTFDWRSRALTFERTVPDNEGHQAVRQARDQPVIRSILVWARFPYWEIAATPPGTRVTLRDLRFGDRVGSASVIVPRQSSVRSRKR